MSKAKLIKTLRDMDVDQLRELVLDIYASRMDAKEYLEFWLDPDVDKAFDTLKNKLRRVYFLPSDKPRSKMPSLPTAKKLIKDFGALCFDEQRVFEAELLNAESFMDWITSRHKGVSMQPKIQSLLDTLTVRAEETALLDSWQERMDKLRDRVELYFTDGVQELQKKRTRRFFRF